MPCELVMGLLSQGAILQLQMGPVPLRPDVARPGPRPERPEPTNPRPEAETSNIRPNVTDESSRTNPSGRSENDVSRPERPMSRHPPNRPVSPFTDWTSLSDNAEVISVPSEDDDYVPRSPEYEPDSPGPIVETEDQNPEPNDNESGLLGGLYFLLYPGMLMKRDPDLLLAEEPSCRGFPLFKGNRTKKETPAWQNKAHVNFD